MVNGSKDLSIHQNLENKTKLHLPFSIFLVMFCHSVKQETWKRMYGRAKFLIPCTFLVSTILVATALDTLSPGQSIKDKDGKTITSASQSFELGFFSPGQSRNRYLGVWYKRLSTGTIAWVANRETPLFDHSGVLSITNQGVLVLLNGTNDVIWSSNGARTGKKPIAQLLETGNLVVMDASDGSNPVDYLWQSFDYPCDTLLPEMKLGVDLVTGSNKNISSWKSLDNPSGGDYTWGIDPRGFPQLALKNAGLMKYRQGPWNGIRFAGTSRLRPNTVYTFDFVLNEKEVYYIFKLLNSSVPSRFVVNASGLTQRLTWMDMTSSWVVYYSVGQDQCDEYAICGVNAICNINNYPVCSCLEGFEPKFTKDWSLNDWSGGCVRKNPLDCKTGEGFVKYEGLKVPDTSTSWFDRNITLGKCEELCLKNCSCMAYTNADIRAGGSGCVLWFGDLIDMREYSDTGQDLYIRMPASYLEYIERKRKSRKQKMISIIVSSIIFSIGVLLLGWILYMRKRKLQSREKIKNLIAMYYSKQSREEDLELTMIDLTTIVKATNSFSSNNKLGKGGFGPVYKGILSDGKEIAVKRLSMDSESGQGVEQFINEVLLIAKLQHRNLVRLLGCCIEGDERILIYEYMTNKSLDNFIFDKSNRRILDWQTCIKIIDGIARGLLYLHEDSRLRIIHRDLKASNVLLDDVMNPKISDFGMARIFEGNQTEENTKRVVGTYGYMAPEYAADGIFSLKSDVFSFGVLILEIVSGKRNRGFHSGDHDHNLLGHAWILWMEERILEFTDNTLDSSFSMSEIVRRIHVGLLCVQQRPDDRPNMSNVVLMLGGESSLPQPKHPGFFTVSNKPETASPSGNYKSSSTNEVTMTLLDPR